MGESATCPLRPAGVEPVGFSTNADLFKKLKAVPGKVDAVFHAAALADFKVAEVTDSAGRPVEGAKIASRSGALTLQLEPALKLIGQLRALFPQAWIAGWKYELDGSREEAVEKARRQVIENATSVCFVNGAAYGEGFGQVDRNGLVAHYPSKIALCAALAAFEFPRSFPGRE
jgi:phosphopantothenoylcysteine decarboxylase/phosphopantothenate--cysteine ligase